MRRIARNLDGSVELRFKRRVTTGHNGDDGRSYFSGFLLRQQRIGTRGHLTCSRLAFEAEGSHKRVTRTRPYFFQASPRPRVYQLALETAARPRAGPPDNAHASAAAHA